MILEIYFGICFGMCLLSLALSILSIYFNYLDNETLRIQGEVIIYLIKSQPKSLRIDTINKLVEILKKRT